MALFVGLVKCCSGDAPAPVAQNPVLTDPTFGLSNSVGALAKVAAEVSVTLVFDFNRGRIDGTAYGAGIDPRAGDATSYQFKQPDGTDFVGGNINGKTAIVPYFVKKGYNDLIGRVTYATGPQPKNSLGADYLQPYAAGSHQEKSRIEGVYPIFVGILSNVEAFAPGVTNMVEQPIISMIGSNYIEYTFPSEQDGGKQALSIANAWLADRPLAKMEYYNDLFNRWEDADKRADFATVPDAKNVSGLNIPYTLFKSTADDRGAVRFRLIF